MIDERFYNLSDPLPLDELLDGINADLPEGQFCDEKIYGAAPFDLAGSRHISFWDGTSKKELNCNALACFVKAEYAQKIGKQNIIALVSDNPRADFAKALPKLYAKKDYSDNSQAKHAFIDETASIGKGTKIAPNAVIGPGVVIGKNCRIGAGAVIEFTIMGDNCHIQAGAVLGGDGFGVVQQNDNTIDIMHVGIVELGDNISIGANTCVDRAMFGTSKIGSGTKMDNLIQIAHNCQIGKNCMFAANTGISGSCIIGDGVIMGGRVGIADHVKIGDGAVLMAGSGVMRDIPAGEVWGGVPAVPAKQFLRQAAVLRKLANPKKNQT